MDLNELRVYANEPVRTRSQLQRVARKIGTSPDVKGGQLLHNINRRIDSRIRAEGGDADSGFSLPKPNSGTGSTRPQPKVVKQPPKISKRYTNENVREGVDVMYVASDLDGLVKVAKAYNVPTAGKDIDVLYADICDEIDSRGGHIHAPSAVDPIMANWAAAHPPPATTEGRFANLRSNGWGQVAAVAVVAIGLFLIALWLMNRDDGDSEPSGPDTSTATATPTAKPSNTPPATATSRAGGSAGNPPTTGGQLTTGSPEAAHFARLESLDPAFRSGGWQNWLSAAGVKCETVRDARQPEEETSPSGKISVAGLQVEAKNCHVPWPNIVTTDVPTRVVSKDANSVEYKPDPQNGSVLYTNVTVTGPVTIWADGQNWGQFTGKLGFVNSPKTTVVENGCFSLAELDSRYGIDRGAQGASNGLLMDAGAVAGAVLKLNADQIAELDKLGWTIQGTNPAVKSAWSPAACRPLS